MKKEMKETTLPTFHDKDRRDGVLQLELESDSCTVDLFRDDPEALKTFPFDSFRFDFGACLAGEKRLENQDDIRVRFDKQHAGYTDDKTSNPDDFVFRPTPRSGEFVVERISYGMSLCVISTLSKWKTALPIGFLLPCGPL
ncbi:unnamed protein product [Amoebophrya sp. A120]|nr:unnamed protein product [Amoebophrya sp. A120]|eukprot:GSA120T00005374001.1